MPTMPAQSLDFAGTCSKRGRLVGRNPPAFPRSLTGKDLSSGLFPCGVLLRAASFLRDGIGVQALAPQRTSGLTGRCNAVSLDYLERVPIGWNYPIDKNSLEIKELEHVLVGKVSQLFRNML